MKALVVYKSKTGFTRKYAEWIADELKADLLPASSVKAGTLAAYDAMVFGGSLHAVGIIGLKRFLRQLNAAQPRRCAVFAVGASPNRPETTAEVRDRNLTAEQRKCIGFFYMRGGFDMRKQGFVNKTLMTLMKWVLQRKANPSEDERGLLAACTTPADFTDRQNIRELVEFVRA